MILVLLFLLASYSRAQISVRWLKPDENQLFCTPHLTTALLLDDAEYEMHVHVIMTMEEISADDLGRRVQLMTISESTQMVARGGDAVFVHHPWIVMGSHRRHFQLIAEVSAVSTADGSIFQTQVIRNIFTDVKGHCPKEFSREIIPGAKLPGEPCTKEATFVTAAIDIGLNITKFIDGLKILLTMGCFTIVHIDEKNIEPLRQYIPDEKYVRFVPTNLSAEFPYFSEMMRIRGTSDWVQEVWAGRKLPLYLPLVLSKIIWVANSSRRNIFTTKYFIWVDSYDLCWFGLNPPRASPQINKIQKELDSDKMVALSYHIGSEGRIHGMERSYMEGVARSSFSDIIYGYMFGGTAVGMQNIARMYQKYLKKILADGRLGTEENILTLMWQIEPSLFTVVNASENAAGLQMRCLANDLLDPLGPQSRITTPKNGDIVDADLPLLLKLQTLNFIAGEMGVICVGIKNLESEEAAVETCTIKRELYIFEGVDRPSSYSVQVWFYSFHQVVFGASEVVRFSAV